MQSYINSLTDVLDQLEKEHDFICPCTVDISISERLRSANGYYHGEIDFFEQKLTLVKIVMSKALLDEFGYETFEKTFRHEVAHLANRILYHGKGHDYNFKILCRKFKGTMNKRFAGQKFSDCASSEYVKTIKKWKYVCPCGYETLRAKRMSIKKRTYKTHVCRMCRRFITEWQELKIE